MAYVVAPNLFGGLLIRLWVQQKSIHFLFGKSDRFLHRDRTVMHNPQPAETFFQPLGCLQSLESHVPIWPILSLVQGIAALEPLKDDSKSQFWPAIRKRLCTTEIEDEFSIILHCITCLFSPHTSPWRAFSPSSISAKYFLDAPQQHRSVQSH